jgi:hypothetical protein
MPYRAAPKSDLPGIQNMAGHCKLKEKLTLQVFDTCQVCLDPSSRRDRLNGIGAWLERSLRKDIKLVNSCVFS